MSVVLPHRTCSRTVPTCSICNQEHDWTVCPSTNMPKCVYCERSHAAVDNICPVRATATRKKTSFVTGSPHHRGGRFPKKTAIPARPVCFQGTQNKQRGRYNRTGGPIPVTIGTIFLERATFTRIPTVPTAWQAPAISSRSKNCCNSIKRKWQ